jgi:subtilisin family serine protease
MINANTGVVNNTNRTSSGVGIDGVNSMAMDDNDNIYLIGYEGVSSNKNMKLIKFDASLNELWSQSFDNGGEDEGVDVVVDDLGNVYALGNTQTLYAGSDFILRKYNSAGTLVWSRVHGSENSNVSCEAVDLTFDDNGDVVFIGTRTLPTESFFYVAKYSPGGESQFIDKFSRNEYTNIANSVVTIDNEIYVSGMSEAISGVENITVKFLVVRKDREFVLDTNNDPLYERNELMVRLDQSALDTTKFNTTDWQTGQIESFLTTSAVNQIRREIEDECLECEIKVYKIFRGLTSDLTTTTSRTGKEIDVPDLWASLIFEFPDSVDITQVKPLLEGLFPLIKYADHSLPIQLGSVVPDDPWYNSQQANLHPTTSLPDAHINIEEAWELETGKRFVRVGVFDSGLAWKHVDFGNGIWGQTKMAHGWDFTTNQSLETSPFQDDGFGSGGAGHGTKVAGIIGAIRDNGLGIAGIAGGNNNSSFNLDSAGVSLYGLATENNIVTNDFATLLDAIFTSTADSVIGVDYDYGLDIQNHSWGIHNGFSNFVDSNINMLREATRLVNRAEVTMVAARQNQGDTRTVYPALFDDDWVICVTATGDDGQFTDSTNCNYISNSGGPIDVGAPGYNQFVNTTNHTINVTNSWVGFGGTSAATPHVTGVAALLMSYLNAPPNSGISDYNDLAPEDVEAIIQMTTDDTDLMGYDSLTGFGRLNAGKALQRVRKGRYKLEHYDNQVFSSTNNATLQSSGDTISIGELYRNPSNQWFQPGQYIVNTYKITSTIQHNILSPFVIDTFWSRHSGSEVFPLFDSNNFLIPHEKVEVDSLNSNNAYLHGYTYEVFDLNNNPIGWWPKNHNIESLDFDYTLLLEDSSSTVSISENDDKASVKVYPNPTKTEQIVEIVLLNNSQLHVGLYDISGRRIKEVYQNNHPQGTAKLKVDTSSLKNGIYVYRVQIDDSVFTFKMIKD